MQAKRWVRSALLTVLVFVGFAQAALAAGDRWLGTQMARVDIDAQGHITAARLLDSSLSTVMQQTLVDRISKVEFEPARINGVAASAQATISISLLVQADRDGMRLLVDRVDLIAGYRDTKAPRYPSRELRRGITGQANLRVEYDAEGKVIEVAPADPAAPRDRFMQAALAAAQHWQLEPERVAGIGIAGTAFIPVHFRIDGEATAGQTSGKLKFPDGGSLQLFQVDAPQWTLASSQVRVRSIDGAQQAIGGS